MKDKIEYPPLLGDGLHQMCVTRLKLLTVWKFRLSTSRARLYDGLRRVLNELLGSGVYGEVWIDGSFLTEKIEPEDVDIILVLPGDELDGWPDEAKQKLLWYRQNLKANYYCHNFVFAEYPASHRRYDVGLRSRKYWLEQFGRSRRNEEKGIALIKLEPVP